MKANLKALSMFLFIVVAVTFAESALAQDITTEKRFAVSAGNFSAKTDDGILFLMGADFDVRVANSLYAFAGTGFTPDYAYINLGAYYLFLTPESPFRPKLIFRYGPNSCVTFLKISPTGQVSGKYTQYDGGTTIGAGFDWLPLFNNSLGIDVSINYALSNNKTAKFLPAVQSQFNKIDTKISIFLGLKYAFSL